jgi:hypothetical protein
MLRYVTSTLTACALATTVSAFAQQPPAPAQGEKPPATAPQVPKETLTGCVMAAKTTTGETAYILNNTQGGSAPMYVLAESPQSGLSQSDWATNVNKKVEVTGPVQQPRAPAAESGAAPDPKVVRPPLVQAESVKVVTDTCK